MAEKNTQNAVAKPTRKELSKLAAFAILELSKRPARLEYVLGTFPLSTLRNFVAAAEMFATSDKE